MSTALDKSDGKEFDEMWELPKFYISACSLIHVSWFHFTLHCIDYVSSLHKELKECISEVEQIEEAGRAS
jgi:hypothetical protein